MPGFASHWGSASANGRREAYAAPDVAALRTFNARQVAELEEGGVVEMMVRLAKEQVAKLAH